MEDTAAEEDDKGWIEVKKKVRRTYTTNGASSFSSTGSARLNLFFKAVRGVETETLNQMLQDSWQEDKLDTLKLLFSFRNIGGGRGERLIFRKSLEWLIEQKQEKIIAANFQNIISMGRFDDWTYLLDSSANECLKQYIATTIAQQLLLDEQNMNKGKPISLCAKWCPSQQQTKTNIRSQIIKALGPQYTNKQYRQLITSLRSYLKIVETFVCTKQYEKIEYSHVPSVCMKRLRNAFVKHDEQRFSDYIQQVQQGTSKINAKALYPHDLVRHYMNGGALDPVIEEQWKEIVKQTKALGPLRDCIPLCDVSGSMAGTPMEVSIALAILISSIVPPPFHNLIISFDETPAFFLIQGTTLQQKVQSVMTCPWGGSTNFFKVFSMLLNKARICQLPKEDMPKKLIVISDMQFNFADSKFNFDSTTFIEKQYASFGYSAPTMIYWNVRANTSDFVATANTNGVAMIAGFSAAILKAVIEQGYISPFGIMKQTIDDPMYDSITLGEDSTFVDIKEEKIVEQPLESVQKEEEEEELDFNKVDEEESNQEIFYDFMYQVLASLSEE